MRIVPENRRRVQLGERFGKLTVIGIPFLVRCDKGRQRHVVVCECECGGVSAVRVCDLRGASINSCGCVHRSHHETESGEYTSWRAMRGRCGHVNGPKHNNYAGRGITVCEEWKCFRLFMRDMGPRPSATHEIDRIDNNGNYEASNCRWATKKEQARNRRTNRMVTCDGITQCLTDWARQIGCSRKTLSDRLKRGWSIETMLANINNGT